MITQKKYIKQNFNKKKITNKFLNKLIFKKYLFNYFFIKNFLNNNFQIFSNTYTILKKKIHNKITKKILTLRQNKILPYLP
jgi:hypothetical protein